MMETARVMRNLESEIVDTNNFHLTSKVELIKFYHKSTSK